MSGSDAPATNAYWGRDRLEEKILDALAAAGKNVDSLTIDDLAPADQFHGGGKGATERLARLAGLKPGTRVLDVGGGLGGPARTLAGQFGCRVTVVDLTESYVRTGARRGRGAVRRPVDAEQRDEHRGQGAALRRLRARPPPGRLAGHPGADGRPGPTRRVPGDVGAGCERELPARAGRDARADRGRGIPGARLGGRHGRGGGPG